MCVCVCVSLYAYDANCVERPPCGNSQDSTPVQHSRLDLVCAVQCLLRAYRRRHECCTASNRRPAYCCCTAGSSLYTHVACVCVCVCVCVSHRWADVAYACLPYHLPPDIKVLRSLRTSDGCVTLPEGVPTEQVSVTKTHTRTHTHTHS